MTARSIRHVNAVLLVAYLGVAVAFWHRLPDLIPIHIGLRGEVTWVSRSLGAWLGLPAIAIVLSATVDTIRRLALRHPVLWNLPGKRTFLALSPRARRPAEESLERAVAWASLLVTAAFIVVHVELYRIALRDAAWSATSLRPAAVSIIVLAVAIGIAFALRAARQVRDVARGASVGPTSGED